jgi:hypothetical protein
MNHVVHVNKNPIRQAHFVGSSVVLTLDPMHVKRLAIDDFTFFEEKEVDNGILLEVRKLTIPGKLERKQEEEKEKGENQP